MSKVIRAFLFLALLAPPASAQSRVDRAGSDCFGVFGSYDKWMDYIWENNNLLAYLAIRNKFDERTYESYRKNLRCRTITYNSGGHLVTGWVIKPKMVGKRPLIIFNRGGNRSYGAWTFADIFARLLPLAMEGNIVVASQYRGSDLPQESTEKIDQFGGDDVQDVIAITQYALRLPEVDRKKVFMIGQSRGAIMSFRTLREMPSNTFRAVAIVSGEYDMHHTVRVRPEFETLLRNVVPDFEKNRQAELDKRSVVRWFDKLPRNVPILVVHGEDDDRTPVADARKFVELLRASHRPHASMILEEESHFLSGSQDEVRERILYFFFGTKQK